MSREIILPEGLLGGRKIIDIDSPKNLKSTCQGGESIRFKISLVTFDEFQDSVPVTNFAVVLDDDKLGIAGMLVPERVDVSRATVEITDSLCSTADCKNGANCIKRRPKASE